MKYTSWFVLNIPGHFSLAINIYLNLKALRGFEGQGNKWFITILMFRLVIEDINWRSFYIRMEREEDHEQETYVKNIHLSEG
jgi:hypothetical protein